MRRNKKYKSILLLIIVIYFMCIIFGNIYEGWRGNQNPRHGSNLRRDDVGGHGWVGNTPCSKSSGKPCCRLSGEVKNRRLRDWRSSYMRMLANAKQHWKKAYKNWRASAIVRWDSDTRAYKSLRRRCNWRRSAWSFDPSGNCCPAGSPFC